MPLTKLEHYLVLTDDIDATRDFYVQALGMTQGFRPDLGFPGHWVYIGDTPVIHIAEWKTYTVHSKRKGVEVSAPTSATGPVDHIAFAAQDYDEVLARLRQQGLAVRPNDNPGNIVRQLFLFDPNGVKIEINFRKG
jgi:catechol 2,3-dioxygenase-like lactoylglutathione lyase family enzyme